MGGGRAKATAERLAEIESALSRVELSAPRVFPGLLAGIRELLEAEKAVAYALRPGDGCLALEQTVSTAQDLKGALDAAMEAIGSPAFLLKDGRPCHANSAGRALLELDRSGTIERLARATIGVASGLQCTKVLSPGGGPDVLAVLRPSLANPAPRASQARIRFNLSFRQAEVLARLAVGLSNKEIGQALGCAEGTVELHVRALLQKMGGGGRAALVARFWTM